MTQCMRFLHGAAGPTRWYRGRAFGPDVACMVERSGSLGSFVRQLGVGGHAAMGLSAKNVGSRAVL
jgi:hypothetical protein